jgi:hypothetical protein
VPCRSALSNQNDTAQPRIEWPHERRAHISACSAQLFLIAEYLFFTSSAISALALTIFFLDRWLVSWRGLPGTAIVEESELIRTLPRKIWEVRIEVIPDDRSTGSFRRRARWSEENFAAQAQALSPGIELRVRFRRAPRPLVMPTSCRPDAPRQNVHNYPIT